MGQLNAVERHRLNGLPGYLVMKLEYHGANELVSDGLIKDQETLNIFTSTIASSLKTVVYRSKSHRS